MFFFYINVEMWIHYVNQSIQLQAINSICFSGMMREVYPNPILCKFSDLGYSDKPLVLLHSVYLYILVKFLYDVLWGLCGILSYLFIDLGNSKKKHLEFLSYIFIFCLNFYTMFFETGILSCLLAWPFLEILMIKFYCSCALF